MNLSADTSLAMMHASQGQMAGQQVAVKKAFDQKQLDKFDVVAKDFEAMFVSEMMKPMFEGIKPDKMFGGGKTEEIFQGILLQEYGKLMAETGQLGIAHSVKAELIKMQENTVAAETTPQNNEGNHEQK